MIPTASLNYGRVFIYINSKTKIMTSPQIKKIGKSDLNAHHRNSNAWDVMKPFVHFGIKATGLIAGTLLSIIKSIPRRDDQKKPDDRNKIIKI